MSRLDSYIIFKIVFTLILLCFSGDTAVGSNPDTSSAIYTVIKVSKSGISIINSLGDRKRIKINPDFKLYRLVRKDYSIIKNGDRIVVLGERDGIGTIHAHIIKTPSLSDNDQFKPNRSSSKYQSEVVSTRPLAIRNSAGNIVAVKINRRTRIICEEPISTHHFTGGEKVRIFPDRLVVVSDKVERMADDSSKDRSLSTALPKRCVRGDFVYGIWLGRGLYTDDELQTGFRLAKKLGISHFKIEFKWDLIEPKNNQWIWENRGKINFRLVAVLAKKYDLSIIPYFSLFMPWGDRVYPDPGRGECEGIASRFGQYQAPDPDEYAEYVYKVVDRLIVSGVKVQYVELDNEASAMSDGHHSWSCFRDISAKDLKVAENAAYDKIKINYPEVMVSSSTFPAPGIATFDEHIFKRYNSRLNHYIQVYFKEPPRPKFDYLGLHEIFPGSGSPFTTSCDMELSDQYNFSSYFSIYDMWRDILDKYGYNKTPMIVTESAVVLKGRQDAQLLQKIIFARVNAEKNNVIGWIVSQLSGSKVFTELPPPAHRFGIQVGISKLCDPFELREGYYAFYTMMATLARYPRYAGRVMGELNTNKPWVEKFTNHKNRSLYAAFIPYGIYRQASVSMRLYVGADKTVCITNSDFSKTEIKVSDDGYLQLNVSENPIFLEIETAP